MLVPGQLDLWMIIRVFPELLSSSGMQRGGRHMEPAVSSFVDESKMDYAYLSLKDAWGVHSLRVGSQEYTFRGYEGARGCLALAAWRWVFHDSPLVLSAQPNLATVGAMTKVLNPSLRAIVFSHGTEVWAPLSPLRKWSLRRADFDLAPSADTAATLVEVQGVQMESVAHLPWSLDPEIALVAAASNEKPVPPGFPQGRVVLTVGRQSRDEQYKGLDTLIQAFPRVLESTPDAHLVVVGEGDDHPRLEELVIRHRISGRFFGGPSRRND